MLILGTEPAYNKEKNKKVKQQTGEWGESDFQSCHIIRFKCPVFNNKKPTWHTKK